MPILDLCAGCLYVLNIINIFKIKRDREILKILTVNIMEIFVYFKVVLFPSAKYFNVLIPLNQMSLTFLLSWANFKILSVLASVTSFCPHTLLFICACMYIA